MGFWIRLFHNECDRSAYLEKEIERLRTENAFLRKALVKYGCEYVDIISAVKEWGENE
jgi:hypothetical protein